MKTKILGHTGIHVSIVGLGGANLGLRDPNDPYRQHIEKPYTCLADIGLGMRTVHAAIEAGVTLIDTAPKYEAGGSETIIGNALAKLPDKGRNLVVTTKIGCLHPKDGFDHSYNRSLESFSHSIARLGRPIDIAYLHDPMGYPIKYIMGRTASMQALRILRHHKKIKFIGIAANDPETAAEYIETGEFDVAAISGAWSLINQKAAKKIIPAAIKHNVGLVITTGLERGILAHGYQKRIQYMERNFTPECLKRIMEIGHLCRKFNIPLVAVALQWCTRHPQVASVIPGARTPEEAQENSLAGSVAIPQELWDRLDSLITHFESN